MDTNIGRRTLDWQSHVDGCRFMQPGRSPVTTPPRYRSLPLIPARGIAAPARPASAKPVCLQPEGRRRDHRRRPPPRLCQARLGRRRL